MFLSRFSQGLHELQTTQNFLEEKYQMDGQQKRQNKNKQHMLHEAMKKNMTNEITDEIINIMTQCVAEVTDIIYPAIIQYQDKKVAERDMGVEEANAKKFVFRGRKRTPSRSPGCVKRGSRGEPTPLFSQESPGLSPTRRPLSLRRECWAENLPEPEPAAALPHHADSISSFCRTSTCMGAEDGKLQSYRIREDISPDCKKDCPKTGIFRKLFSLTNVQGRVPGYKEQVQWEEQMPRQRRVPEFVQPTLGDMNNLNFCTGALGLKPTSTMDTVTKPRAVRSKITQHQTDRQLTGKSLFSSHRKTFPGMDAV
ncbi:uncharacterized protein LOC112551065 [Alligator sinensis]|uniref:Uncharacterized protein LOC112551065 n=1 Tax=Alligator sinensis TaxID=38654 RepID=A0A3Q0H1Z4_ALLSI|nr:uncharacterized protein LOC112551065 [Alligator sinensis]